MLDVCARKQQKTTTTKNLKTNLIHTLIQTTKTHAGCVCKETTKKHVIHTFTPNKTKPMLDVCARKRHKNKHLIHTLTQPTKTHAGCVCMEKQKRVKVAYNNAILYEADIN